MILYYHFLVKHNIYMKAFGVGILILILGYVLDIRFLQKKFESVIEQKIRTNQLLQNKNKNKEKVKNLQTQYSWACDFDSADILNDLEKSALDSHVRLQILEPQAAKEDEFFIVYPIKIEIAGKYKNLLMLINNLFKQYYFIAFEELILQKMSIDVECDELNMQVSINIYKNKIYQIKNTHINNIAINKPENDIFSKTISKINLFLWANKELTFIGMIKQNECIYGFVGDPTGIIHRVAVGDKIGLKQNEIIAIDGRGIKIKNSSDIYRRE